MLIMKGKLLLVNIAIDKIIDQMKYNIKFGKLN